MEVVKLLGGGSGLVMYDYMISATVVEGQPVIASSTAGTGGMVTNPTTTSLLDLVGIVLGAASFDPYGGGAVGGSLTYSTTQNATPGLVRVVVNSDAVMRALMSGGAGTGTALTTYTAAAANAGGTTFTDADATTSMDEGIAWGILPNANVGIARRITTHDTGTGAVTVTVPFPRAIAASDAFLLCPYQPTVTTAIQLTTAFTQVNASIVVGTGGAARAVELVLAGAGDSYVHFMARDHAYNELS